MKILHSAFVLSALNGRFALGGDTRGGNHRLLWSANDQKHAMHRNLQDVSFECIPREGEEEYAFLSPEADAVAEAELEYALNGPNGSNATHHDSRHSWTCELFPEDADGVEGIDLALSDDLAQYLDEHDSEVRPPSHPDGDGPEEEDDEEEAVLVLDHVDIRESIIRTKLGRSAARLEKRKKRDNRNRGNGEKRGRKPSRNIRFVGGDERGGEENGTGGMRRIVENYDFRDVLDDEGSSNLSSAEQQKWLKDEEDIRRLHHPNRRGLKYEIKTHGTSTVLALRVIAADSEVSISKEQLSASIFGGTHNGLNYAVSLQSQMDACSYGKLKLVKAEGPGIVDGVLEVTIPQNIIGVTKLTAAGYVTTAAKSLLGSNWLQFDHVMYCIPPGTSGSWIGYGYYWWWRTLFNDRWCGYVSNQMHEIGHNLNLRHSGQGTASYGDQSSVMGYSYAQTNAPKFCYNAGKSALLGWYKDRQALVDPMQTRIWTGKVTGVADYGDSLPEHNVIVELLMFNNNGNHLFMTYNIDKGVNEGTKEFHNSLTILESKEKAKSTVLDFLPVSSGSTTSHIISNFDGTGETLVIQVLGDSSGKDGTVDYAWVQISVSCEIDNDCTDNDECNGIEECRLGFCSKKTSSFCEPQVCMDSTCTIDAITNTPQCAYAPIVGCVKPAIQGTTERPAELGVNVASNANIEASPHFSDAFRASYAIDGSTNTQYASGGKGTDTYIILDFNNEMKEIDHFGIQSRSGVDFVSEFALTFSDGSSESFHMDVSAPKNEMQYFDLGRSVSTSSIRYDVDAVDGGRNPGAVEIGAYAVPGTEPTTTTTVAPTTTSTAAPIVVRGSITAPANLGPDIAPGSTATASSEFSGAYAIQKAIDNDSNSAWASKGDGIRAWAKFVFGSEQRITAFAYHPRGGVDAVYKFTLKFSDGSTVACDVLTSSQNALQYYDFGFEKVTSSLEFKVDSSGENRNVGAKQIHIYAAASSSGTEVDLSTTTTTTTTTVAPSIPTGPIFGTNVAPTNLGTDLAKTATMSASSEYNSNLNIYKSVDGLTNTAWASKGEGVRAWAKMDFGSNKVIKAFAYQSRGGVDLVTKFTLTFSDGSNIQCVDTSDSVADIQYYELGSGISTSYIEFNVDEGGAGTNRNVGAMEFSAYEASDVDKTSDVTTTTTQPPVTSAMGVSNQPTNLGRELGSTATMTASSEFSTSFLIRNAVDNNNANAWASKGDRANTWGKMDFGSEKIVDYFAYQSRGGVDLVTKFTLSFSDGSTIQCTSVAKSASIIEYYDLGGKETSFIKFDVDETSGNNPGGHQLRAYEHFDATSGTTVAPAVAAPITGTITAPANPGQDIAPSATLTPSSEFNANHAFSRAFDGDLGTQWASLGEKTNTNALIDFGETEETCTYFAYLSRGGVDFVEQFTLQYSDGTQQPCIMDVNYKGSMQYFDLGGKKTTSIKFMVDKTSGNNPGATEMKVFASGGSGTGFPSGPVTGSTEEPVTLPNNIALDASVTASSEYNINLNAHMATDGDLETQWASNDEGNDAWIELTFANTYLITDIAYKSRAGSDFVQRFKLTFTDQSTQVCEMNDSEQASLQYFDIEDVITRSVKFDVEDGGLGSGAYEIEVYGIPEEAEDDNTGVVRKLGDPFKMKKKKMLMMKKKGNGSVTMERIISVLP